MAIQVGQHADFGYPRLWELEQEDGRFNTMYADLSLDRELLKVALQKKF